MLRGLMNTFFDRVARETEKRRPSTDNISQYIPILDNIDNYDLREVVLTPQEISYLEKVYKDKLMLKILEKYSVMTAIKFLGSSEDSNQERTRGFIAAFKFLSDQIRTTKKKETIQR